MSPFRNNGRPWAPENLRRPLTLEELQELDSIRATRERRERWRGIVVQLVGYVVLLVAMFAFYAWVRSWDSVAEHACEARGGVWLWREGKCVSAPPGGAR